MKEYYSTTQYTKKFRENVHSVVSSENLHRVFFAFNEVKMGEDLNEDHLKIIYREIDHKL